MEILSVVLFVFMVTMNMCWWLSYPEEVKDCVLFRDRNPMGIYVGIIIWLFMVWPAGQIILWRIT